MKKLLFFLSLLLMGSCTNAQFADEAYYNGKIYTADANQSFAEAIAIKDGIIIFVGSDEELDNFIREQTQTYDLEGLVMLPGFHDVHVHTLEASSNAWGDCDLQDENATPADYAAILVDCDPAPNSNGWITATGFTLLNMLDYEELPIDLLDEYFPETPVVILEETSHAVWVNSAALEAVGFDKNTPDPIGGHLLKDDFTGHLTGLLLDNAGDAVLSKAFKTSPTTEEDDYIGLVEFGLPLLAENGITSMADGRTYWKRNFHKTWQRVKNEGKLTARVSLALWAYPDDSDETLIPALQALYNEGDDMLKTRQIKLYSDGIIINATAAMHEDYHDHLGLPFKKGLNYFSGKRLQSFITELEKTGFDFHIHAIGDRAITESLDAVEFARNTNGDLGARHRITHCEVMKSSDYPRFAKLNVIADVQVAGDFTQPENWEEAEFLLGKERLSDLYPIKSLYEADAHLTLSSDWDVSELNPFIGIQNAVTRVPQELPTVAVAIDAYTIKGAYVMRQEDKTGSLEAGKYADLILIDRDIFSVEKNQIRNTNVLLTMLEGEIIFEQNGFSLATSTSIDENRDNSSNWQLFPNVVADKTTVKLNNSASAPAKVTIINTAGQIIQQQIMAAGQTTLDLWVHNLAEGTYFVKIILENGLESTVRPLVVVR